MVELNARAYGGGADLPLLVEFASRAISERFPLPATWHPGDFIWELKAAYDQPHDTQFWISPSGIEAVAWSVARGAVWLEVLPGREALVPAIVGWAEQSQRKKSQTEKKNRLAIRAFEGDTRRIQSLEALGYRRLGPEGVWFRMDLSKPAVSVKPLDGFSTRDCVGIDPALRAAVHRDAWNDLTHIGLEDARSSFTMEVYLSLRSAPGYDPTLDIVVAAPDGQLVANCICWADERSNVGIFEPVGTSAAYRARGLARLAILEGLRRLRFRGMAWARVGTAHFNAPAIATYRSCGFEMFDRTFWWSKSLTNIR